MPTYKKIAFYDEVATTFDALSDTPANKTGSGGKYVKVNAGETALEYGLAAAVASGLATLDASSVCAQAPKLHASAHQNGGGDEISVAGLSGLLADGQTPLAHEASHKKAGSDEILLNEFGDPAGAIEFAGQQASDFVLENLASDPTAVLGKIYFKTGDTHPYVCTAI